MTEEEKKFEWKTEIEFFRYNEKTKRYKKLAILERNGDYFIQVKEGTKGSQAPPEVIMFKLDKSEMALLGLKLISIAQR